MNKGLELIEAHHLFGLPYDRLEVLVHPQSIVHALVEYMDGSQSAVLSRPDMRIAVAYALSHPRRWPLWPSPGNAGLDNLPPLDLTGVSYGQWQGHLTFETPDYKTFPAPRLAEAAGREGGTAPAALIGATEEAVKLFLAGAIAFADIPRLVGRALEAVPAEPLTGLDHALAAAEESRSLTKSFSLDLCR
jgi:1-deoxy-D-xylulose-5-phosphate reductoisomerase